MNDNPLVSVIIPAYNAEQTIVEAVESVLSQSYENTELIVVDDGSVDNTRDLLLQYKGRIKVMSINNGGAARARNHGLFRSGGEYIQFLDADDMLEPSCIKNKIELSRKIGFKDIAICEIKYVDEINRMWVREKYSYPEMIILGTPQTSMPLYPRLYLEGIGGFDKTLPCSQEYDLNLRLARKYGIEFVSNGKKDVFIRPLDNSLSASAGSKMPLTRIFVLEKIFELEKFYSNSKYLPPEAIVLSKTITWCAKVLWNCGEYEQSILAYRKAQLLSEYWFEGSEQNRYLDFLLVSIGPRRYNLIKDRVKRLLNRS